MRRHSKHKNQTTACSKNAKRKSNKWHKKQKPGMSNPENSALQLLCWKTAAHSQNLTRTVDASADRVLEWRNEKWVSLMWPALTTRGQSLYWMFWVTDPTKCTRWGCFIICFKTVHFWFVFWRLMYRVTGSPQGFSPGSTSHRSVHQPESEPHWSGQHAHSMHNNNKYTIQSLKTVSSTSFDLINNA